MLFKLLIFVCVLAISSSQSVDDDEEMNKNIPGIDAALPTPEQLLKMLDSMGGISDEEKETLRKDLLKNFEALPQHGNQTLQTQQTLLLFSLLGLLTLIFAFFGYKLYRTFTEKERQKEERKRIKQTRKTK